MPTDEATLKNKFYSKFTQDFGGNIAARPRERSNQIVDWFLKNLSPKESNSTPTVSAMEVLNKLNSACEESLSPDYFEMWQEVKEMLIKTRSDLK